MCAGLCSLRGNVSEKRNEWTGVRLGGDGHAQRECRAQGGADGCSLTLVYLCCTLGNFNITLRNSAIVTVVKIPQ